MTIQELQNKIREFSKEHNLDSDPEYKVLDTVSELGEVAKEILKMTNYGKDKMEFREEIKSELGDLLYSVITIANAFDVDLETAVSNISAKYEKRLKRGGAGSEYD
ncbi:MAG: MazG nucleotide pyrophosphohydrolase [Parcubacteria group bacterium GW2011_GWB1_52_7]|nr:MAG: MazG nucleotide pyrophosphohydrolase [Parcubacteria group bacterium GW2011_GWB1_52_7]KKW31554.1 MAG: MazG nucleotide pyrophosphohydrolase [Parcubacteria group bacterium GW2011_GWC2_52_8c]